MFTPGANISTVGFTLEKLAILSKSSVALTEKTLDPHAGDEIVLPALFPAAAAIKIPKDTA